MPKWGHRRCEMGILPGSYDSDKGSKRETGLEPATFCLGSWQED
jgi:hypothetical protein